VSNGFGENRGTLQAHVSSGKKISLAKEGAQHQLICYHGEQDDPETVNYILQETANNIVDLSKHLNMNAIVACAKLIREANIIHVVSIGKEEKNESDCYYRCGTEFDC
jgi:DNA-binding MurR/RpiR family transcriptional regulator